MFFVLFVACLHYVVDDTVGVDWVWGNVGIYIRKIRGGDSLYYHPSHIRGDIYLFIFYFIQNFHQGAHSTICWSPMGPWA